MIGVLFDLDGVLLDTDRVIRAAANIVDEHLGDGVFFTLYEGHRKQQNGRIFLSVFIKELVEILKQHHVYHLDKEVLEEIFLSPPIIQPHIHLLRNIIDLHIPYRVLTDGEQREQMIKMQNVGLDVLCDGRISIYQQKMTFFEQEVQKLLDEGADEIIFIEDKAKNLEEAIKYPYMLTGVWFAPDGGRFSDKQPTSSEHIVRVTTPKDTLEFIQSYIEKRSKEGEKSYKERK